ncbi:MAG: hypothetical protein KDC82_05130, partial [Bacteroidetes bacterium]|nr:hypothetical protein [Bacteroidota bacterium]
MKEFLTFLFYFLLLGTLVYKAKIFKSDIFSKRQLWALYSLKMFSGLSYVLISKGLIKAGDIFLYFEDSKLIYQELLQGRVFDYFYLCFAPNGYLVEGNIAKVVDAMGFWWDSSAYMVVRLNAIFNFFSFASIYTNALFFAFLSFLGSLLLVRSIQIVLKPKTKWVLWTVFLSPSLLYWTAGMHKESICVFLIACLLFGLIKILRTRIWYYYLLVCLAAVLLWFKRFFILALLIPPLVSYIIWYCKKFNRP